MTIDFNGAKPQTSLYSTGIMDCLASRSKISTIAHTRPLRAQPETPRIDRLEKPPWQSKIVRDFGAVDDLMVHVTADNGLIIEFWRLDDSGCRHSYQLILCPEDAEWIRAALA